MPLVPCTGIFLGPNKSGWIPVKKYIEEDLGVNTERERAYYDEWDEAGVAGHHPEAAQDHRDIQEVGDEEAVSGADNLRRLCR